MIEEWHTFNASELIELKKLPRITIERFFRINPYGEIMWFDHTRMKWRYYPVNIIGDEKYFITVIGSGSGNLVRVKILIKDLIEKYFDK